MNQPTALQTCARRRPAYLALASWLVLGAASAVAAPASAAADAAAPAASDSAIAATEIVVTAQKRSEDIKSVPISVSALSGGALQAEHVVGLEDITRVAPNVAFNTLNGAEGRDNISIRGVSSTAGQATVGMYLDDVSITVVNLYHDGSAEPRLPDLDRIEVLRGPQGTLWGASSEGGTIRFISQAPNMDRYSGEATSDVSYTEHGAANYAGSGMLNAPIIPGVFALRGSFSLTDDSGYINNYGQTLGQETGLKKKGVNAERGQTFHLIGKFTPGDDLTITPGFFFQKVTDGENGAFYPSLGLYNQDKQVQEHSSDTLTLGSLSIRKGLGWADLTSITGLFRRQYDRQEDGTYFNSTAFALFFLDPLYPQFQPQNDSIIANLPSRVHYRTRYQQISQEFRLSSSDDEKHALKWVAGIYFADQNVHNIDFQQIPGINTTFQSIYGMPMEQSLVGSTFGGPGITLFPNDIDEADNRTYHEQQGAVFGQADYDFLKTWHVGLGGRFVTAKEDFVSTEIGFYQIGNINPYNQSSSFTDFTPKATLSHDLDKESTVYASVGKGFRLGGPTGPIVYGPTSVCAGDFAAIGQTSQPIKFASDSLWTYELGSKNRFLDNRVSLNFAGYYTNWTNIQQEIYLPTCGYYFTSNVGDATIYGGEAEAVANLTDSLKLTLSLAANHSEITRTNNPTTVAVGQQLIDVPDVTATAGAAYSATLPGDFRLNARAEYAYTGSSHGSYTVTNSNYNNPGYGVANLNVAVSHGAYELSLYAKNLFDNQAIIQHPEINTVIEGYTLRPRTVGVMAKVMF
ncbi:MAG TPA: TonB-dependent receptor [Caulobacteraceae bacterium]|jgi:outer membrane receptor protein involved in Fe transport